MNYIDELIYDEVVDCSPGFRCQFPKCMKEAVKTWPAHGEKPGHYCEEHLEDVKYKLQVALGRADSK